MPATDRRYCVCGVHWADAPDAPEFLAVDGKIVLFDTLEQARDVLPALGRGRFSAWDADRETLFFTPLVRPGEGFNRLAIWTGYDPFDVPNGFRSKGVWSEAQGRDWKHHVHHREVLPVLLAWAQKFETRRLEAMQRAAVSQALVAA